MSIITTILIIILSVGALQGIVYGLMQWWKKRPNPTAARLMTALLFFFSYRLIIEVLLLFGLGKYDVWYHLTQEFNWIYGPLTFLVVKAWLAPRFRLSRKDWIYLLPVGLELICNNFVRWQNFYWDGTRESLSWMGYWGYVVWMNYPVKYIVASLLMVAFARRAEVLVKESQEPDKHAWLARVLYVFKWYFGVITCIVLVDFAFFFDSSFKTFYWFFTRFYYYPFFLGIAGLTYWLGIEGYHRKQVPARIASRPEQREQLTALAERLDQWMQDKNAYQDPEISLHALAQQLDVKSYLISQCLKEVMHTRFTDYINQLRIDELKRLLRKPGNTHLTLLSLAYESGFNSKASFHRAVKKYEGVSPGELRKKMRK